MPPSFFATDAGDGRAPIPAPLAGGWLLKLRRWPSIFLFLTSIFAGLFAFAVVFRSARETLASPRQAGFIVTCVGPALWGCCVSPVFMFQL